MRKIRVALGSNDEKSIVSDHMGMAEYFYIYDLLESGKSSFVEKRENISQEAEGKHGLPEKMKAVMEILKDADVIVGRRISPNFISIAGKTKFQPVVMKIDGISEVMKELVKHFGKIYDLVEQRKTGNRPKEIPELEKG